MSSSGQYQSATISAAGIYSSSDYGLTWVQTSASSANWTSVAMSSSGQYQTGLINGGGIYTCVIPSPSIATNATNLSGGAAGNIPYQTSANNTSFISNGTSGQVLTSQGSSVPVWATPSGTTQWDNSGNNIYFESGNVGIGTNNPNYLLDIGGLQITTQTIVTPLYNNPFVSSTNTTGYTYYLF
jgi:hypothetical protein